MKAFIFDPLWDELVTADLLESLSRAGVEIVVTKEIAPLAGCKALFEGDEDRLLCLNPDYVNWKLTSEQYRSIPHLKGIFTESTGFEWVNPDSANEKNIPICNIVKFNTQSIAEWAVMVMLNLARQTPRIVKDGFPLDFDKDFMKYRGIELKGKTAGIIGLGSIGTAIAEKCHGLGMNVVYWSRSSTNDQYQKLNLEELLSSTDVLFPATAINEDTKLLITDDMIRSMKDDAILVDITHSLLNEPLILEMVANGDLFGYGFEAEPKEFTKYKGNVWATPAYAWATYESMYNCVVKLVDNIVAASKDEYPHRIN